VATVLPCSERLRALVGGAEYEEAVVREAARFGYRVLPPPALSSGRAAAGASASRARGRTSK